MCKDTICQCPGGFTGDPFVSCTETVNGKLSTDKNESQAGMQKIILKIKNEDCGERDRTYSYYNDYNGCGGQGIRVKVTAGNKVCYTQPKPIIYKNHFAKW